MKYFFDAVMYLMAFLIIQFVSSYAVCAGWALVEGESVVAELKAMAGGGAHMSTMQLVMVQVVAGIITMLLFLALRWSHASRSYLRSKPYGVLFWAGVAVLGTVIPSQVFLELVPLPNIVETELGDMMGSSWGYLAVCIFAPLVEELVFRGAILRVLLEGTSRHWVAIFISSVMFALAHFNPAQMPHAFCLGLLLGWMYYRTGSIVPGVVLHWVNNTLAYVVYNIFPQYNDVKVVDLFGGNYLKVGLAVIFSLFILLPAIFQLHLRMKKVS